jgi:hypothetical protein
MAINNVVVGNTATSILTATADSAVVSIVFYNDHTSTVNLTLYAYPSGGSAGAGSTIMTVDIPTKDSFIWSSDEKFIIETDDVISAVADVDAVLTATISYLAV